MKHLNVNTETPVKLTQHAQGGGCGCKISPEILHNVLHAIREQATDDRLLVDHLTRDDAAVYEIEDGNCIVSTTDFFTPVVDNPIHYGAIASANAISDIYAMGARPVMALAILGWPLKTLPVQIAQQVMEGARIACAEAGIPLAGGHSIDCPEPLFGLAVTGLGHKSNIKKNSTAQLGSSLYLTKPLGVGIITTAHKKGDINPDHLKEAITSMRTLNTQGLLFGTLHSVNALTDVTGFGLLGHLIEICESSHLSAQIEYSKIPRFSFLDQYEHPNNYPGGTQRNLNSYEHKVKGLSDINKYVLADPQTSGGLLVCVDKNQEHDFQKACAQLNIFLTPFGCLIKQRDRRVEILQ